MIKVGSDHKGESQCMAKTYTLKLQVQLLNKLEGLSLSNASLEYNYRVENWGHSQ